MGEEVAGVDASGASADPGAERAAADAQGERLRRLEARPRTGRASARVPRSF